MSEIFLATQKGLAGFRKIVVLKSILPDISGEDEFIRYSLWSWAPFLLERNFGLKGDDAGYLSTLFDFAGIAGVIVTGILSDKVFKSRRAGVSLLMMVAMFASCLLLYLAGGLSVWLFAICLALIGFTLYGPDALMSGAGAMDLGSRRGARGGSDQRNGLDRRGGAGVRDRQLLRPERRQPRADLPDAAGLVSGGGARNRCGLHPQPHRRL